MKKQTVVLVWSTILLLVIACCVGGYFIWDEASQGYTKTQTMVAFSCVSTNIEEYTVVNSDDGYTIERSDDGWIIEDNPQIKLDQEKVSKLMSSVSNITATGTVSRKDFEKLYTNDEKVVKIELDDADDVKIRFMGTYENLCAFKVSDDKNIYVMNLSMIDILAPKLDALRISTVFTELSKIDTLPSYYYYKDYDDSITEIRSKTSAELAKGTGNSYVMERPYKREINDDRFEQQISLKIPALKVKSFIRNPEDDLSIYGLDRESRAELKFKWDGYDETLYFGKTENGAVYALKKGSDDVFTIDTSLLEFLKLDTFYIQDNGLLKAHISRISSIELMIEDMVYTISSNDRGTESPKFYVCGKMASREVFEDVLDELGDMEFLGELTEIPENTEDILIKVYYDNGAYSQKISLTKLKNKNYAAFIDGKAEFSVDGETVADLVEEVVEAYNNPMKRD